MSLEAWGDESPEVWWNEDQIAEAESTIEALREALRRIERWFGEFPSTGKVWTDGTPMSYGAAYGINGERDYMRQVARDALTPNAQGQRAAEPSAGAQSSAAFSLRGKE